jgi:hypothetical protein
VGSQFRHGHVFRSPPIIPDGRVSPGPVGSLGLSRVSLPIRTEAQALVRIRPKHARFAHLFVSSPASAYPGSVSERRATQWHHQVPRVPLPDIGVTFIREACIASCEDITPRSWLLRTHAPIPLGSPLLQPKLRARSLGRLLPAPAAGGTIPTLSLRILPWLPGPLSRRYVECMCLFLPPRHRPSPVHYRGRLSRICPSKRFLDGSLFRDCSHFFMFRPPGLLTPQIVPTAVADRLWAAGAFIRAEHASFPPHASDIANHPNTGN